MDTLVDVFSDDAFNAVTLTAAINELDTIPGRAGDLAFAGTAEGISTTAATIESLPEGLSLIPTTLRGAPAPIESQDKRKLLYLALPHIQIEATINADSVQNVREFGSTELTTVTSVVDRVMLKMSHRLDLTLENHRLGALRGQIKDADGSVLTDLYSEFGVLNSHGLAAPEDFEFSLEDYSTVGAANSIRTQCQQVQRFMRRHAKSIVPQSAKVWAFCGDNFFDKLLEHPSVKETYDGYAAAKNALGDNYAFGIFEYGGVFWENYQGTDDNSSAVGVASDECRFFLTGVPGLYAEYYAPGDFIEAANTLGLPRYAKLAQDQRFQRFVEMHVQSNPLPLCLRPQTLCRGVIAEAPSA